MIYIMMLNITIPRNWNVMCIHIHLLNLHEYYVCQMYQNCKQPRTGPFQKLPNGQKNDLVDIGEPAGLHLMKGKRVANWSTGIFRENYQESEDHWI